MRCDVVVKIIELFVTGPIDRYRNYSIYPRLIYLMPPHSKHSFSDSTSSGSSSDYSGPECYAMTAEELEEAWPSWELH